LDCIDLKMLTNTYRLRFPTFGVSAARLLQKVKMSLKLLEIP
jgi:hypothetical protein